MKLTLNKRSAHFVFRAIRAGKSSHGVKRTDLIPPEPSPGKRWTKKLLGLQALGWDGPPLNLPLFVAVSSHGDRLQTKHAVNTIYGGASTLPSKSFIEVQPGLAISSPELLFVELARSMSLPELLMLGFELCGGFSRDPRDPLNGPVAFECMPVSSFEKIAAYLEKVRWVPGVAEARRALEYLSNAAWSPTEAIVTLLANLPLAEFGYELGPCVLNKRVYAPAPLAAVNARESRVPDILFGNTHVGINYDGAVHLDLDSIVNAALEVGRNPGGGTARRALDIAVREVRAKVVDDIRRNRELAAAGYTVFPVVKEDLYEEGGLDKVMLQVIEALEAQAGWDCSVQRRMLKRGFIRKRRQELIWSGIQWRRRYRLFILQGSSGSTTSIWT